MKTVINNIDLKKYFIPPVFLLVSFVLIILFSIITPMLNWFPYPFNFTGLLISVGGFALMGKTRDLLEKHDTTVKLEPSNTIITESLFSKVRNPMYLGMFLLLLGMGILFRNIISLIIPFIFIILINYIFIPIEEKLLEEKFGPAYLDYKSKVKKWIWF